MKVLLLLSLILMELMSTLMQSGSNAVGKNKFQHRQYCYVMIILQKKILFTFGTLTSKGDTK